MTLPSLEDVKAAAHRIAPHVRRTPLLRCAALEDLFGAPVLIKAECLQRGGAFKARGAFSAVTALSPAQRANGVLAFSSGNHAIAVATAAQTFGVPAVIVMPADAPAAKLRTTRALGAEVLTYDRLTESREEIGARLAAERALPLIKPFDDPQVIAGQGTAGLELAEQVADMGLSLGQVLVCTSGGGLAAGIALAIDADPAGPTLLTVEPDGHDDVARSLRAGEILPNPPGVRSICDALLVERMGQLPFAILSQRGARGLTVSDAEVQDAMRFAARELRLVVEPGGAVALAAVLWGKAPRTIGATVVVVSGGNVDLPVLAEILAAAGG
jgi:threonine dehydratase